MKIFGNKNNLGTKAKNIVDLYEDKIEIPKTYIIEKGEIIHCNFDFLNNSEKYILRPSFDIEDGTIKSLAGYYKSIFPISKNELIKFFQKKDYSRLFHGKYKNLKSVIIQEFIETHIYGVYFSRDPNNIFKEGLYEIGFYNNSITSGKESGDLKLNFFHKNELALVGTRLEKLYNYPQDIEFCIKNGKITILQTRNITTGNYTFYEFQDINNFSGFYKTLDYDELGEMQDFFSYQILKNLFDCIYLDGKIYFKQTFFHRLFLGKIKNEPGNLNQFKKKYKKYLKYKVLFHIVKYLSFQKLDKNILTRFFKNYGYSFLLNKKSNLDLNFDYKGNFLTRFFIKTEEYKNISFFYLEEYKKEYIGKNFIGEDHYNLDKKLFFLNGKLKRSSNVNENYIYKGQIQGIITDLQSFDRNKKNQVLIITDLDFHIFDKLENLSGIIVKNGNLLSHNSIIIREYKIPSIVHYKGFEKLKIGEEIRIQ